MTRAAYYARYRDTDERVELIEGQVYHMSPPGPRHSYTVTLLRSLIEPQLVEAYVSQENPIVLPGDNDPQPDLAVVHGELAGYKDHHPGPNDLALVIEVADESIRRDRQKRPVYAKHGIPEYWIIDLKDQSVVVHRAPSDQGYQDIVVTKSGILVSESAGCSIDVAAVFA